MSSEEKKVSRRGYVKYAGAAVVVVAVGAAGAYYASQPPAPPPTTPVVTTPKPTTPVATTPTTPVATPTETYPPPSENPLVFNIWGYRPDIVEENAREFEKQFNEAVRVEVIAGDYPSAIETKHIAKAPLDMHYGWGAVLDRFYAAGWIRNIEDLSNINEIKSEMFPNVLEDYKALYIDKKLCGLPYFCSTRGAILVNEVITEKAGLKEQYPKTYSEMYDQLETIKKKGFDEPYLPHWFKEWIYGIGWGWSQESMNCGDPMFDDKFDAVFDTNTPAMQVLKDWKYLYDNGFTPKGIFTAMESDYLAWFATGEYAYSPQQSYDLKTFNDPAKSKFAGHCTMVPYDKQSWGHLNACCYLISERPGRSKHDLERVKNLLVFYGYKDKNGEFFAEKKWATENYLFTPWKKLFEMDEVHEAAKKWMVSYPRDLDTTMANLMAAPPFKYEHAIWAVEWETKVQDIMPEVLTGGRPMEGTVTELRNLWNDLKKKYT